VGQWPQPVALRGNYCGGGPREQEASDDSGASGGGDCGVREYQGDSAGSTDPCGTSQLSPARASPEAVAAVRRIVAEYRGRLKEIVERAAPPHDLPPIAELRDSLWIASGSRRPALEQAFKSLGYTCRGESGTFSLRRKTQANLTAQLYLDVGTWSRHVTAIFQILGVGFKASMTIPVAVRALGDDSGCRPRSRSDAIPDWRRRTLAEDR
jgi:hypothetical protein